MWSERRASAKTSPSARLADEVLKKRAAELERFHRLSVGRELQMVELKKQVNDLAKQAGQKPPYDLAFLEPKP